MAIRRNDVCNKNVILTHGLNPTCVFFSTVWNKYLNLRFKWSIRVCKSCETVTRPVAVNPNTTIHKPDTEQKQTQDPQLEPDKNDIIRPAADLPRPVIDGRLRPQTNVHSCASYVCFVMDYMCDLRYLRDLDGFGVLFKYIKGFAVYFYQLQIHC